MDGKELEEFAANLDTFREALRALVAGLIVDGFTDEQAHEITAYVFTRGSK